MELVPFSLFWFITTALEMFLVVWWLRSPVGRVWIHFFGGLLSRRPYWAPPYRKFPLGLRLEGNQSTVMSIDLSFSFADLMLNPGAVGGTVKYRVQGVVWIDAGKSGRPMFGPMGIVFGELPVISPS